MYEAVEFLIREHADAAEVERERERERAADGSAMKSHSRPYCPLRVCVPSFM